jgi:integrase
LSHPERNEERVECAARERAPFGRTGVAATEGQEPEGERESESKTEPPQPEKPMNDTAKAVIEACRGEHPERVFVYRGKPVKFMNNSAWQKARKEVGLPQVRVHDLKHTFGRRLRAAGVPLETRKVLLGHKSGDITTHYSAPEIAELLEAANRVAETRVRTLLRVIA